MPILQCRFTQIALLLVIGLAAAGRAHATLMRVLDTQQLLASSDAIYKIEVQSSREDGIWKDDAKKSKDELPRMVATARVISVIKGAALGNVMIEHPGQPHGRTMFLNGPFFVVLSPGKTYLVFLMGKSAPYRVADVLRGVMEVRAGFAVRDFGNTPADKLLAELLAVVENGDAAMRTNAVVRLGELGDRRAAEVLRVQSRSEDLAKRTSALVARIAIGDAPAQEDLLAILRIDPSSFKSPTAMYSSGSGLFAAGPEQVNLVHAIARSVTPSPSHSGRAEKQLKDFDYLQFVTKALDCKVIQENDILRADLVGALRDLADPKSLSLLVKLLDDPGQQVRYMATTSIAVLAKTNKWFPAIDTFSQDEARYIQQARKWAEEHPDGL